LLDSFSAISLMLSCIILVLRSSRNPIESVSPVVATTPLGTIRRFLQGLKLFLQVSQALIILNVGSRFLIFGPIDLRSALMSSPQLQSTLKEFTYYNTLSQNCSKVGVQQTTQQAHITSPTSRKFRNDNKIVLPLYMRRHKQ
jgi:hypothetical protein